MIDGVTLLNQYSTYPKDIPNEIIAIVCLTGVISAILAIISDSYKVSIASFLIGGVCMLIFLSLCVYNVYNHEPKQTYYQVTIEDNVSVSDFLDHYDVVKQEGQIYTIIEKGE